MRSSDGAATSGAAGGHGAGKLEELLDQVHGLRIERWRVFVCGAPRSRCVCVVDAKDAVLPSLMHSVCICVSMCVYGGGGEVHAGNSCTRRFRRMPP